MTYALITNGAVTTYPYTYAMFRAADPNVSFPAEVSDERLAEWGIYAVAPVGKPTYNAITENVVEGTPVLVGDVWTQVWSVVSASADEIANRQAKAAAEAAKASVKADGFVGNFIAMTPAQVEAYVQTNVTNLATAKDVIAKMGIMLLLLARREFK
jgi:hypothetical protein